MITINQLAGALYGTWLLLKFDPRGFEYFEKTPQGFARSFLVAAVLAPLHFAHVFLMYQPAKSKITLIPYVVVQGLTYVLLWVGFPFAMLYVTQLLNREPRYFWYMVPYNWALQLAAGIILLPVDILSDLHMLPTKLVGFVKLMVFAAFVALGSFIARIGLKVTVGTAIGIVVLDIVLTQLISVLTARV